MATTDTDMRKIHKGRTMTTMDTTIKRLHLVHIMLTMNQTKDTTIRIKASLSKIPLSANN